MAQARKTVKAQETEQVEGQAKKGPSAILGQLIKFTEAIKLADEQSPLNSANGTKHVIKLLPNGWASIQKTPQSIATLVPAGNILYFIPEK